MRKTSLGLILAAMLVGAGCTATAADLVTPPLLVDFGDGSDNALACIITNLSPDSSFLMNIEMIGRDGKSFGSTPMTVPPGGIHFVKHSAWDSPKPPLLHSAAPFYCKFSWQSQGPSKTTTVRASACAYKPGVGCVAAVQAQPQ